MVIHISLLLKTINKEYTICNNNINSLLVHFPKKCEFWKPDDYELFLLLRHVLEALEDIFDVFTEFCMSEWVQLIQIFKVKCCRSPIQHWLKESNQRSRNISQLIKTFFPPVQCITSLLHDAHKSRPDLNLGFY